METWERMWPAADGYFGTGTWGKKKKNKWEKGFGTL